MRSLLAFWMGGAAAPAAAPAVLKQNVTGFCTLTNATASLFVAVSPTSSHTTLIDNSTAQATVIEFALGLATLAPPA